MKLHKLSNDIKLPIMEYFYSIQGEGFYSGKPAFFIRLAGCDVGCVWCDVKESWDRQDHQEFSVDFLVAEVLKTKTEFCVITGGEPALYDLTELTKKLKEKNIYLAIETSGAYEIKGDFDWVCLSPKKFKLPKNQSIILADELKIIVFNKHDFKWAEKYAEQVSEECKLYLQPEWGKRNQMEPFIFEYVKENPRWNISLQTHKYLGVD